MLDKTLIVNGIDISDCPAMNTFNIFGFCEYNSRGSLHNGQNKVI